MQLHCNEFSNIHSKYCIPLTICRQEGVVMADGIVVIQHTWKTKYLRTTPNSTSVSDTIFCTFLLSRDRIVGNSARKIVSTIPGSTDVMILLRIFTCSMFHHMSCMC